MTHRKNRPVLFEVSGATPRSSESKLRDASRNPTMPFTQPRRAAPPAIQDSKPSAKWVERDSNGLRFELSWPMVGGLAALLLVLVGGSFAVGKISGSSRPRVELSAADNDLTQLANRAPAESAPQKQRPAAEGAGRREPPTVAKKPEPDGKGPIEPQTREGIPPAPQRIKGATYLIVQHFRKSEAKTARKAQEFLQANGIECALEEDRDIRLFATQPFQVRQANGAISKPQQQAAEQLRQRVRQLGKEFAAAGNGYAFDQCFLSEEKK